jgi:lipid-A-disaccharide synthase-like uncharacterized protein
VLTDYLIQVGQTDNLSPLLGVVYIYFIFIVDSINLADESLGITYFIRQFLKINYKSKNINGKR